MLLEILTDREWLMLLLGSLIYVTLFVLTVQNSRRKVLDLQDRLNKVRAMQETQQAQSQEGIDENRQKIGELEALIRKLGDENSVLKLELEEKKNRLSCILHFESLGAIGLTFSDPSTTRIKRENNNIVIPVNYWGNTNNQNQWESCFVGDVLKNVSFLF